MSGRLTSWSNRRAAVAAEAAAHELAEKEALVAEQQQALSEKSDEEILEELGLPDPDDLKVGDDFKAFLSKAVPAHLRKRALRNLWRSNPVLACVDGLNDYDDDYLTGSVGQGSIKTSYKVGKGMLSHLLEMERQKDALLSIVADPPIPDGVDEPADLNAQPDEAEPHSEIAMQCDDEMARPPEPRRMKFQFEGDVA